MHCDYVKTLLPIYLDEGLSPETTRAIEEHLAGCENCRAEGDALASAFERARRIVRTAGEQIAVPDVHWVDSRVQRGQPERVMWRPVTARRPIENHPRNHRKPMNPTTEPEQRGPAPRRLAGAISFAIVFGLLLVVAAALSGLLQINSASAPAGKAKKETPTPTAFAGTPETQIFESDATATPTAAPSATPDMADGPGGFVENAVDVSTLPKYVLPNGGGGGGGGGGGCPDVPADQTVEMLQGPLDQSNVCLYDIPSTKDGTKFTITLTSPSGRTYTDEFSIQTLNGLSHTVTWSKDTMDHGYALGDGPRKSVMMTILFVAGQDYGEWKIEASGADGKQFASGTITPKATAPIYSVTEKDNPPDPFDYMAAYASHKPGSHLLVAGRGLAANKAHILGLYAQDPALDTAKTLTMVPYYATRVAVGGDGFFGVEFVVGKQSPRPGYTGVLDPEPESWQPLVLFMSLDLPQAAQP